MERCNTISFKTIIRSYLFPALSVKYSSNLKSGARIRSVPGKRVRPVRSSAMMQPTDQMSTVLFNKGKVQLSEHVTFVYIKYTGTEISEFSSFVGVPVML